MSAKLIYKYGEKQCKHMWPTANVTKLTGRFKYKYIYFLLDMPPFTVKNLEIIVIDTGDIKQKTNHKIFEATKIWI